MTGPPGGEPSSGDMSETGGTPPPATILVVDDVAEIRGYLQNFLTRAGYDVTVAADGVEALQRIRRAPVDVVLMDLVMPEMEGLETIQNISTKWPEIKIIAISGAFGGQFLQTALLMGAHATLAKPIGPDDLLEALRRVLGH